MFNNGLKNSPKLNNKYVSAAGESQLQHRKNSLCKRECLVIYIWLKNKKEKEDSGKR